ncbi:MAG: malto-oligosyltrehalose trehalohydrolase, partial [Bacteroidota bacterium]
MKIGAQYKTNGDCEFVVWAPLQNLSLQLLSNEERIIQMEKDERGFWRTKVENLQYETCYRYILNSSLTRPDPASHFQPQG